jgi:hypothetical protein
VGVAVGAMKRPRRPRPWERKNSKKSTTRPMPAAPKSSVPGAGPRRGRGAAGSRMISAGTPTGSPTESAAVGGAGGGIAGGAGVSGNVSVVTGSAGARGAAISSRTGCVESTGSVCPAGAWAGEETAAPASETSNWGASAGAEGEASAIDGATLGCSTWSASGVGNAGGAMP